MEQFFCMASIFSDSMVLQRGESATIFGRGEEGADVEVRPVSYTHLDVYKRQPQYHVQ